MANTDERSRPATSSVINTNLPNVVVDSNKNSLPIRATRCATGSDFIKTIHGILNIVVMVALICVLISAGVAGRDQSKAADYSPFLTRARVSAFHTRNAVLVFASFGLFLIFLDTLLHVTKLINSFSAKFEFLFIIVMIIFAFIYLILGCCSAAWEQKMRDRLGPTLRQQGAAAAAAFFLFVSMIGILINFALRSIRPTPTTVEKK